MRNTVAFLFLMTCLCLAIGSLQPFDMEICVPSLPGWPQSPPSDFAWNIVAYAPFGACACPLLHRRLPGFVASVLMASAFSLLLESAQSMSALRVSSWVDVIANVLGAAIGAGLVTVISSSRTTHRH